MFSLIINSLRLSVAIIRGILTDGEFLALLVSFLLLILSGTLFYTYSEGWSVVDAIYFCVMTMSTTGYGDLVPTNDISKIFTVIFSLLGIGLYASLVGKIFLLMRKPRKK